MIKSFADRETEKIFNLVFSHRLPTSIQALARRKMIMLNVASELQDLRFPPGNHLEMLHGDRARQYSICINDQWRICFYWIDGNSHHVEIVDYH